MELLEYHHIQLKTNREILRCISSIIQDSLGLVIYNQEIKKIPICHQEFSYLSPPSIHHKTDVHKHLSTFLAFSHNRKSYKIYKKKKREREKCFATESRAWFTWKWKEIECAEMTAVGFLSTFLERRSELEKWQTGRLRGCSVVRRKTHISTYNDKSKTPSLGI